MNYRVKEIFYTLQGEGANAGRPAVFCRFSGCNLWSGKEEDRLQAICQFCDTDFVGTDGLHGGVYATAQDLACAIDQLWPKPNSPESDSSHRFVVFTGGEPLLQMDAELIEAIHQLRFEIAVETNGTIDPPPGIDWICVSPKANAKLRLKSGNELKLVYPQLGFSPELFEELDFETFYLQPMDGKDQAKNIQLTIEYCKAHPRWRLSIQMHKIVGIP